MHKLLIICMLCVFPLLGTEPPTKSEIVTQKRDIATGIGLFILAALTAGYVATTSHK